MRVRDEPRGRSDRRRRATGPTGVELTDGTRIATDLVISDLGLPLHRAAAPARACASMRRCAGVSPTSTTTADSCSGPTWRFTSRPATRPSATIPGSVRQPRLYWGPKDLDYLAPAATSPRSTWTDSPADRTCCARSTACGITRRAPAGSHIVGVEEFAAPRRQLHAPGEWREIKERVHRAPAAARGPHYAPNMTAENVIALRRVRAGRHRAGAAEHDRGRLLDRRARSPRSSGAFARCPG